MFCYVTNIQFKKEAAWKFNVCCVNMLLALFVLPSLGYCYWFHAPCSQERLICFLAIKANLQC